jgi:ribosomal protein S18 acetylase RimI-like enzyme
MEKARIEFAPSINDEERMSIVDGLDAYNVAVTGLADWEAVNFVLRGEKGQVLGGLIAPLWGGWLHVSYLWVAEAARGQGFGSQLLGEAEAYARARGAMGATLETYSFQARPFYERLGYEVCGTLESYPPGGAKFFLKKLLA